MTRRVLITGSNRGLGRAIAEVFHTDGWRVASLNRTVDGTPWLGEVPCDLADSARTRAAVAEVIETQGGLDACVLNAAVRRLTPIAEMTDDDWDISVATNLSAVFWVARAVIPALTSSGGTFVVIGSQAARHPFEGGAAYCGTKAALEAFTRVLLLETRPLGIRTMLVSPGAIRNRDITDDHNKIQPTSLARVVLDLASGPPDMLVSEIEVRPAQPVPSPLTGVARLQAW